jgi:putative transposase
MNWLQSTFSTRFSRFRGERGHFFQGRFTSAVLEDDHAVRRVVDYIHLNPVRAKLVSKPKVGAFRLSSLNLLIQKKRMKGLDASVWMEALELKKTAKGWRKYLGHLAEVYGADEDELVRNAWAVGSQTWRRDMAKTYAAMTYAQCQDLQAAQWEARLLELLAESNRSETELGGGIEISGMEADDCKGDEG